MVRSLTISCFVALCAAVAHAQPVLITTPTTLDPGATTIGGVPLSTADITVSGTTLTVNGAHTIRSLILQRDGGGTPALLTHAPAFINGGVHGLALTVNQTLTVQGASGMLPASSIDVSGKGFGPAQGPGAGQSTGNNWGSGAGHGGRGGTTNIGGIGGVTYGSLLTPTQLGSGGGNNFADDGGPGGGCIRLNVLGAFTLDGPCLANGPDNPNTYAGGGSGGSIWITAATLSGSGSVSANGGNANSGGGGGGGGRVVVDASGGGFTGAITSAPGTTSFPGGYGGNVVRLQAGSLPTVLINPNNQPGAAPTVWTDGANVALNFDLRNGAVMTFPTGSPATLQTSGSITIDATSALHVDGKGFGPAAGPAAGQSTGNNYGGGGGHAGRGGIAANNSNNTLATYGDPLQPITMGSGGGDNYGGDGGRGGGALHLIVGGALTVNGRVSANSTPPGVYAGQGAGGSLWIEAASLGGTGTISATPIDNGNPNSGSGGGGGGRVALYSNASTYSGVLTARGGPHQNSQAGGAGVIVVRPTAAALASITVDGGGYTGNVAGFDFGTLQNLPNPIVFTAGARMEATPGQPLFFSTLGQLTFAANSLVVADGCGFGPAQGPGAGQSSGNNYASGAGHGGAGGLSTVGAAGGPAYGNPEFPTAMGSGGGNNYTDDGGRGGGAVRIKTPGDIVLNGLVSANGGGATTYAGGGSGGSILLEAASISGSGILRANGGPGSSGGGGGGGGRIALISCNTTLPQTNLQVNGSPGSGGGSTEGATGTKYFGSSAITFTQDPVPQTFYYGGDFVSLAALAQSTEAGANLTYRWRRKNFQTGQFVPLDDSPDGRITGTHTNTINWFPIACADGGTFDCLATDSCGSLPSIAALVTVIARADFNFDGALDSGDYLDFLIAFAGGGTEADVDVSGSIDSGDFLQFLIYFGEGC